MYQKISVLGCGRWASFMAWYANKLGKDTSIWGREGSARLDQLLSTRTNDYLKLPDSIKITSDLSQAISSADCIIISINAQALRNFLRQIRELDIVKKDQAFVLCMKGLEIGSGKRLSQIFNEEMPDGQVAIWVGPGHVQSFYSGVPNCMVVDSQNDALRNEIIDSLGSDLIRFYYGDDLIGNEIGAATKNIIGIAAGMLDGLGLTALKGALMARAPREIARIVDALGGKAMSAYGLAHLGDYEATLFSTHSNNRQFGESFIRGIQSQKLAEGVSTLQAVHALGESLALDLPICNCLYGVLFDNKSPKEELDKLFARPLKKEFLSSAR